MVLCMHGMTILYLVGLFSLNKLDHLVFKGSDRPKFHSAWLWPWHCYDTDVRRDDFHVLMIWGSGWGSPLIIILVNGILAAR